MFAFFFTPNENREKIPFCSPKTPVNNTANCSNFHLSSGMELVNCSISAAMVVPMVENHVQLKKVRIAKFIQIWKKKFLLLLMSCYYRGHGNVFIFSGPLCITPQNVNSWVTLNSIIRCRKWSILEDHLATAQSSLL